jgi:hypothetical protein
MKQNIILMNCGQYKRKVLIEDIDCFKEYFDHGITKTYI